MTSYLTMTICLFYLGMGVIASAVFITSSAHTAVKMIVPSLIVAIACVTLIYFPEALGYPVETDFASLPQQAELVAFIPHDEEKTVDLWLRETDNRPRAYSIPLTDGLKATLQKAKQALASGPVVVGKRPKPGKKRPHQYSDIDGGNAPYELLPNALSLPAKE